MGKIENLEKYIDLCSEKNISINEKINFLREVIGVYGSEISNMSSGLDSYVRRHREGHKIDYDGDMDKIKAKLINYKDNLELEEQKRKDELELARLNQGNIHGEMKRCIRDMPGICGSLQMERKGTIWYSFRLIVFWKMSMKLLKRFRKRKS